MSESFSRPGAVDLSSLSAAPAGGEAAGGGGGAYVVEVAGQEDLAAAVQESMTAVVIVSFYNADTPASVQVTDALTRLSDEFAGKFLLARIDTGAQAALAQQIGVPGVPFVAVALQGRLQPLFNDAVPEPELRQAVEQILQAAVANGISGRVKPRAASRGDDDAEVPSRFPEADEALMSGDLDTAVAAYERAVTDNPGDDEAAEGLARAQLMKRTQGVDLNAARQAAADHPDDLDAQMLVADLDLMGGHVEDAFLRLVELVKKTTGDDRNKVRTHLVELFGVVGTNDPRVLKGRQSLANALF